VDEQAIKAFSKLVPSLSN